MTAKPVLYVANVDESDLDGKGPLVEKVRDRAAAEGGQVVAVCARLEAEVAELDEAGPHRNARKRRPQGAGAGGAGSRRLSRCSASKAISPPGPRKSAPGRSPSARPARRRPA